MLKNYCKIAWRNLRKHSFYTILNVLGLSLGISCALILLLFVQYHLRFNVYHQKTDNIYRVVTDMHLDDGSIHYEKGAPQVLLTAIHEKIPQIKESAFLFSNYRDHVFTITISQIGNPTRKIFSEHGNIGFADSHWFTLFDYEWLAGNPATSLNEPNTAVLTQTQARRYFGDTDPLGMTIRIDGEHEVKITGLLKDYTVYSDTRVDLFLSLSSMKTFYPEIHQSIETEWGWFNPCNSVFLLLDERVSPKLIDHAITDLTKENMKEMAKYYDFHLQPLKDVHFDARYGGIISKSLLTTLGVIGLVILMIAIVNFINLAIAQNARRTKEISTRRILGSSANGIFWQFMIETAVMTIFSVILSLIWITVTLSVLNSLLQTTMELHPLTDITFEESIFCITIFITITAGIYPSFMLARLKPVESLKSRSGKVRQPWLRKSLILFQNLVAQSLIICTLVISLQTYYVKTADLGFDKDAVVMIPIPKTDKKELLYLRNNLMKNPDIKDVSFCFRPPASETFKAGSIKFDQRDWESYPALGILGDAHFLKTFGLQLIAGRNLEESDTTREFLVSEDMIRKLGLSNPDQVLGHSLIAGALNDHPGTIVGVVRDLHLHSLRDKIEPLLITTNLKDYANAGVKIAGRRPTASIEEIKRSWESVYPDHIFEYRFLDEQIADFYKKDTLLNKLVSTFAVIAIIISCLGLLGLISLLTIQRTKEIGIRKVLGASVLNITSLLSRDFIKPVIFALVLASGIAWIVMSQWLLGFAYRITIPWWVFLVAGICNFAIVLLTICYHAIKAASINPVKNLRTE